MLTIFLIGSVMLWGVAIYGWITVVRVHRGLEYDDGDGRLIMGSLFFTFLAVGWSLGGLGVLF